MVCGEQLLSLRVPGSQPMTPGLCRLLAGSGAALVPGALPTWDRQARAPENHHLYPALHTPQEVRLSTWSPLPPGFHRGIPLTHTGLDNAPLMGWLSCSHPSPPLLGFPGAASQINDWCFHLCLRLILREPKLRNSPIYFSFYLGPLCILFPLLD